MEDPLFRSRNRDKETGLPKAITIQRLNQILAEAAKALGLDDHVSSHSMRKTYAYQQIKGSNYDQKVMYALQHGFNHSDIRITMIYSGIEDDIVKDLREKMGDML